MIEKERLEELIKQGTTIYEVKYDNINPVSLKTKIRGIHWKYGYIAFEPLRDEKYLTHKYFKNLFETKEEAEFALGERLSNKLNTLLSRKQRKSWRK